MPLDPTKITARIVALGLSKSEFARRAGLDRQQVERYTTAGSTNLVAAKLFVVERIAKALEVNVLAILSDALPPGGEREEQ